MQILRIYDFVFITLSGILMASYAALIYLSNNFLVIIIIMMCKIYIASISNGTGSGIDLPLVLFWSQSNFSSRDLLNETEI